MIFEHIALNVREPLEQVRWYVDQLGFQVVRGREDAPYTHFLADGSGRTVVELYHNPDAAVPDHGATDPLNFHFAVVSEDAAADRMRLEDAGARFVREDRHPDGSVLVMLRDPWGLPLQLCQRAEPFPTAAA